MFGSPKDDEDWRRPFPETEVQRYQRRKKEIIAMAKEEYNFKFGGLQYEEHDPVNYPSHYKVFPDVGGEAIHIIEKTLSAEEFKGFLKGNALKYRLRAGFKDAVQQDIDKAKWYQQRLFDLDRPDPRQEEMFVSRICEEQK